MSLLITTITDFLGQLTRSVQLSTVLPASVLTLLNVLMIMPQIGLLTDSESLQWELVILSIIMTSYLFWLLNGIFAKFLEGYTFEFTWIGQIMRNYQYTQLQELDMAIDQCSKAHRYWNWRYDALRSIDTDPQDTTLKQVQQQWRSWQLLLSRYQEKRRRYYPPADKDLNFDQRLLPTRLGNTLLAFETVPLVRYKINAPLLWPYMLPVLDSVEFTAYVEREKAGVDFLINLTVVLLIFGLEALGLAARFLNPMWLLIALFALVLAYLSYSVLVENSVLWGNMIKVAFDLYRHKLRQSLHVRTPTDLTDERYLWSEVCKFFAAGKIPKDDVLQWSDPTSESQETQEEIEGNDNPPDD